MVFVCLPWQPDGIIFTPRVSGQKSAFSLLQEKLCVGSKKITDIVQNCHDVLYQHAKFGADRTTRAGSRSENWCFFLYVTLSLPASEGHSSNKYCVTVYGLLLMPFSKLFQNRLFFQVHQIFLVFVARWRHNFTKLRSKIAKKTSKKRRISLCAPMRIDS